MAPSMACCPGIGGAWPTEFASMARLPKHGPGMGVVGVIGVMGVIGVKDVLGGRVGATVWPTELASMACCPGIDFIGGRVGAIVWSIVWCLGLVFAHAASTGFTGSTDLTPP